uniref:Uncharacterized protein n=1 Tax=Onchocerca volvulus TaxID=6282 RepID=A0A8R1TQ68_ONCVO
NSSAVFLQYAELNDVTAKVAPKFFFSERGSSEILHNSISTPNIIQKFPNSISILQIEAELYKIKNDQREIWKKNCQKTLEFHKIFRTSYADKFKCSGAKQKMHQLYLCIISETVTVQMKKRKST